jgi:hypothetical protein
VGVVRLGEDAEEFAVPLDDGVEAAHPLQFHERVEGVGVRVDPRTVPDDVTDRRRRGVRPPCLLQVVEGATVAGSRVMMSPTVSPSKGSSSRTAFDSVVAVP